MPLSLGLCVVGCWVADRLGLQLEPGPGQFLDSDPPGGLWSWTGWALCLGLPGLGFNEQHLLTPRPHVCKARKGVLAAEKSDGSLCVGPGLVLMHGSEEVFCSTSVPVPSLQHRGV